MVGTYENIPSNDLHLEVADHLQPLDLEACFAIPFLKRIRKVTHGFVEDPDELRLVLWSHGIVVFLTLTLVWPNVTTQYDVLTDGDSVIFVGDVTVPLAGGLLEEGRRSI